MKIQANVSTQSRVPFHSTIFNSIIETATATGLNTYQCLELLLTELLKYTEDTNLPFIEDLLPWSDRFQKERPSK